MTRRIVNHKFYGGFYVFIKAGDHKLDGEILDLLEVRDYCTPKKLLKDEDISSRNIIAITESKGWKHVMEGYAYSLCFHLLNKKKFESKLILQEISKKYALFQCHFSDVDDTFSYRYYNQGELKRAYVVTSKFPYKHVEITLNKGELIDGEKEALEIRGMYDSVFKIAELYGVNIYHEFENMRFYDMSKR